jgi:putative DNA primase/helicase
MAAGRYELASQSDGLGFRGVLGRENTSLTEELTAELAGILSWSLDGLDRLTRQGKFTWPKSSTDSMLALQDFVSPVAAFVRDGGEVGIGHEIPIADHFGDWRLWCEDNGHKPGSVQTFGRDLRAVIPTLKVTRPRADDDSRGYELDVAYRRGIGTVQVPNRGTNDVRQITA